MPARRTEAPVTPWALAAAWCSSGVSTPALAQSAQCQVDAFRGAMTAAGAETTLRMRNTGEACLIRNYGVPAERTQLASSGRITRQAGRGKATFVAPDASYVPEPGFTGEDNFAYEARASTAAANHLGPLAMYLAAGFSVVRED